MKDTRITGDLISKFEFISIQELIKYNILIPNNQKDLKITIDKQYI